jgi:hypothetical protein
MYLASCSTDSSNLILLSCPVLNPYGEIGSGYPSISVMVIGSRLLYEDKDGAVWFMRFINCWMVVVMEIKIP